MAPLNIPLRTWFFAVASLVLVIWISFWLVKPAEPKYLGKPMTYWLTTSDPPPQGSRAT